MHALQFEDEQFQILDLSFAGVEFGLLRQHERLQRLGIERVEVGKLSLAFILAVPGVHTVTMSHQLFDDMKIREHFREDMF